jgi:hypothetical protein
MHTEKFGISSKLQEILCLLAQDYVFEEAEETLHTLLGISICGKQIQRVSEYYGEKLEESEVNYREGAIEVPLIAPASSSEPVYITTDGSMVYSREDGWKEMKVGRIYCENSRVCVQEGRTVITDSLYACTFGNSKDFLGKFEPYIDPYKHKVFIADGAKWI